MDEQSLMLLCLQQIEDKLGWKPHDQWKDHEFKILKKYIQESSGISITTHTLKRLFGKIKYSTGYNPQHATKNALANYLGYDSWEKFIQENQEEARALAGNDRDKAERMKDEVAELQASIPGFAGLKKPSGRILRTLAVLVLLVPVAWWGLKEYRSDPGRFSFGAEHQAGPVPNTVTFRFDLSAARPGQFIIDFDYTHPTQGSEFILTDRSRTFINHTFQIPGIYHPRLLWNDRPVDSALVVAQSEGWVSFYHGEDATERFWLDNMVRGLDFPGHLTFSRKALARWNKDTTAVYYTTHRYVSDFGISGDHFRLTAVFRNNRSTGGISCFDSRFSVLGEHTYSMVDFVEKNCHRYSRVKFGEQELQGDYHDLSALTFDPDGTHEMEMVVMDKQASVFLDGREVYALNYREGIGRIRGLEVFFKGSGQVEHLVLAGIEGDTVYYGNFNPQAP